MGQSMAALLDSVREDAARRAARRLSPAEEAERRAAEERGDLAEEIAESLILSLRTVVGPDRIMRVRRTRKNGPEDEAGTDLVVTTYVGSWEIQVKSSHGDKRPYAGRTVLHVYPGMIDGRGLSRKGAVAVFNEMANCPFNGGLIKGLFLRKRSEALVGAMVG